MYWKAQKYATFTVTVDDIGLYVSWLQTCPVCVLNERYTWDKHTIKLKCHISYQLHIYCYIFCPICVGCPICPVMF